MNNPTNTKVFKPNWCLGCGNYGIHAALLSALKNSGQAPEDTVIVGGIGCGGSLPYWSGTYGLIGLHGRAIPIATGIKMANRKLKVIVVAGDGDTYGIGLNHFIHGIRRDADIVCLVCDNGVYGLTKGQASPTSPMGFKSPSTPNGNRLQPLNPLALALTAGCGFVARGYAGNVPLLADLIRQAIEYPGFAFIDVLQPCVTYNRDHDYAYHAKSIIPVEMTLDRNEALSTVMAQQERTPVGLIFKADSSSRATQADRTLVADPGTDSVDITKTLEKYA